MRDIYSTDGSYILTMNFFCLTLRLIKHERMSLDEERVLCKNKWGFEFRGKIRSNRTIRNTSYGHAVVGQ